MLEQFKKQNKRVRHYKWWQISCVIALVIIVIGGVSIGSSVFYIIKEGPRIESVLLGPSIKYLSNKEENSYVALEAIPENLKDAFIAIEDERFYEHNGIDLKAIVRAMAVNLQTGSYSQGGSTITQQVIKNCVLTPDKNIRRKIQEQYLALQLEKIYDKDKILEYYLNTIALGQGTVGVQQAAKYYFDKEVSQLSLAESVVLASITQAPSRYNPISDSEANWERVQVVLQKMTEQDLITEEEKQVALSENPYKVK
ncbi:hypothetical protein CS063_07540 [Sporanaerobium hydrogeniformans]|uniref:Uncharacterized protein n=1 Tax=Sporanaerobium hydrogeniformans TaxID=3072179 RepID=A0AC61DDK4_9FIRM|nr:biosynthetic peptidoglycan transglycosylase [Sporanaerobium hydrogeniformans]PHV70868.1 hypothetical protein CS063_07540 [Sporanaerobium hydrogeniformans]